jgi:hypothetical protein
MRPADGVRLGVSSVWNTDALIISDNFQERFAALLQRLKPATLRNPSLVYSGARTKIAFDSSPATLDEDLFKIVWRVLS